MRRNTIAPKRTANTQQAEHASGGGAHVTPETEGVARGLDAAAKPPCTMKCVAKQDDLLKALLLAMKAVRLHTTSPVMLVAPSPGTSEEVPAYVELTCSNGETAISIQCNAKIERAGTFIVPARLLLESVRSFEKGRCITIEVKEPHLSVQCLKRVFKLKGNKEAHSFPEQKEMMLGDDAPCTLDTDIVRQAIKEVQFAAADDDALPVVHTICTHIQEKQLTLVGMNGSQMAVRTITLPIPIPKRDVALLVPVEAMRLLSEVMPPAATVTVTWDTEKTQIVFQTGRVQLATHLVAGTFPHYHALIPTAHVSSFVLARRDLEQMLKADKVFAQGNATIELSYRATEGIVRSLATSEEMGEAYDELDATIEGPDGRTSMSIQSLMDMLKHVPADAFVFQITDQDKPGLITPLGRQDYFFVFVSPSNHAH